MNIATNVSRDIFGGITISNLALFDWLEEKEDTIVGIEFLVSRRTHGAVAFRRYDPSFFRHHIVTAMDVMTKHPWERAFSRASLRRHWAPLVDAAKDALREERPDVVLVNGTYYASWILSVAARELGLPVVLRYAGVLKREVAHHGFLARRRLLAYEQEIARTADVVVFPSSVCRQVVEREITGRPIDNGVVIPNPVVRPPAPARRRRGPVPVVAAIGRWTPVKDFPAFVTLHEHLRATRWPHRAVIVTTVTNRARRQIPESVDVRATMDPAALAGFYRSVDLVVVTSRFETFSNVAVEALLLGTPVLVSENVGFSDILKAAGLQRMVIPSFDDPAVAAAAVKRLAKSKVTSKERAAVAALVDPQAVHDRLLRVLRSVRANHRS